MAPSEELIRLVPGKHTPKSFLCPPAPPFLSLVHLTAMLMEADASRLNSGHSAALKAKSRSSSGPLCHELPRRQVNCGRFQPSITTKRFPSSLRAEREPHKPGDKVCWVSEQLVGGTMGSGQQRLVLRQILLALFCIAFLMHSGLTPNLPNIQRACQYADFST